MINALSLFSSAGIAETYFKKHKINVKVANELLPERAKIYSFLYPDTKMIQGDITDNSIYNRVIELAKKENCTMVVATPPCQGMSTAGKQLKNDPRNALIKIAIDAILAINPEYAIIENVPEILKTKIKIGSKWIYINDYIYSKLQSIYNINENKVVNSMNYGVPQSRFRCVYLLTRKDKGFTWEFPEPSKKIITMREAIGDLPSLDPEITDIDEKEMKKLFPEFESKKQKGLEISKWHYPPKHKLRHVIAMLHTAEGQSAWNNNIYYPKLADGTKSKGYKNTYKRQWWDKPAYTITRYTSRLGSQENGHPGRPLNNYVDEDKRLWSDPRVLTIYELILLTSLPKTWDVPIGTSPNVIREVLGECIPPKLLEAAIKELNKRINNEN